MMTRAVGRRQCKRKSGVCAILCLLLPVAVWAHGVEVTLVEAYPCVLVKAAYHGGKGLGDAGVTVFYGGEEGKFQSGRTDPNGLFAFHPDRSGIWRVAVDDGMGHRKEKEIHLTAEFWEPVLAERDPRPVGMKPGVHAEVDTTAAAVDTAGTWCCDLLKIVVGGFLILALTAALYWWRKRRKGEDGG